MPDPFDEIVSGGLDSVHVACECGFEGEVRLYDIGDGPEWNCPSCDWCWPASPEFGPDGKTNAERKGLEILEQYRKERGWPSST